MTKQQKPRRSSSQQLMIIGSLLFALGSLIGVAQSLQAGDVAGVIASSLFTIASFVFAWIGYTST